MRVWPPALALTAVWPTQAHERGPASIKICERTDETAMGARDGRSGCERVTPRVAMHQAVGNRRAHGDGQGKRLIEFFGIDDESWPHDVFGGRALCFSSSTQN